MKKTVWIAIALIAALCMVSTLFAGCGETAGNGGTGSSGSSRASSQDNSKDSDQDNHPETDNAESRDAVVVTIGEETFTLHNEAELVDLRYPENYVDFNTDRIANLRSMSYNYAGEFSFEVRINCEEEHSFDEVKALMSEYDEKTKEVSGITYTYYEYKNDLGDDVHYYLYEYKNKTYSIIFFPGNTPGNTEEVFMNNVRFV